MSLVKSVLFSNCKVHEKYTRQFVLRLYSHLVSLAAVFSIVTQRSFPPLWGGALRDDTKNGCEGD